MVKVLTCLEQVESAHTKNFRVRDIQLLSFIFFVEKKKDMGRLLQINTGEGKSVIVRLVAGYFALLGRTVDIITSKNELAQRDAKTSEPFFSKLGLTVAYLPSEYKADTPEEKTEINQIYQSHVIYSTVHNFCVADLKQYMVDPLTHVREQDFLIVDEVDSMLIDKPDITTYISQPSYYHSKMMSIFRKIWELVVRIWHQWKSSEFSVEQKKEKVKRKLTKEIREMAGADSDDDFRELVARKAETWADRAILAHQMQANDEYVISENKVKILDHDTGETQKSMQWADGLHFFVEKKHGIANTNFNSTCLFENHMTYICKYKEGLVGLSGTVGSEVCKKFLFEYYNVDNFKMPTFCKNRYQKQHPVLCETEKKWHKKLLKEIKRYNKELKRPVLMIFETIRKAEEFDKILKKTKYKFETKKYLKSHEKKDDNFFDLEPTSIILATNYGGRGTDFRVPDKVSRRGGLHVVVTFTPSNSRVERQAFGRAARKGQEGSGRMILNSEESPWLSKMVGGRANGRSSIGTKSRNRQ